MAAIGFMRFTTTIKKSIERFEFISAHVPQLAGVALGHLTRQSVQELDAIGSDANLDDTSILRQAFPIDQTACLQAIQQSCHVRSPRNEPRPQL